MSETRACPECRGAAYLPTKGVDDHTGYEPCPACKGEGRVWEPDLLRDGEPCGTCPDTMATCSAPELDGGRLGNE